MSSHRTDFGRNQHTLFFDATNHLRQVTTPQTIAAVSCDLDRRRGLICNLLGFSRVWEGSKVQ